MDTGTESVVYFIQNESNGRVKIGCTSDFRKRFFSLQAEIDGMLNPLGVIPGADFAVERELHERFADHWVEGEWFRITPQIARFVSHHTKPVERPEPISEGWGGSRNGSGRPKGPEYTQQITVRVTEEQYEYLSSRDVSAAEYIRSLIERDMPGPSQSHGRR